MFESSKPSGDLSFFQNYKAHIHFLSERHKDVLDELLSDETSNDQINKIYAHEINIKSNFFTPFHDPYDATDECLGATLLPLVCALTSVAVALWATKEIIHEIGITCHIFNDDDSHAMNALISIGVSVGVAILSVALLVKFSLSLLTRTCATAADAISNCLEKTQSELCNEPRFLFN